MTHTAHTPTPWETDVLAVRGGGPDGYQIALCDLSAALRKHRNYDKSYDEAVANAAFIVRACNAHNTLVDALEYTKFFIENRGGSWAEFKHVIEAALAKAEIK